MEKMKYDLKHLVSGIFILTGTLLFFIIPHKEIWASGIDFIYLYMCILFIGFTIFGVFMWIQANEINKMKVK